MKMNDDSSAVCIALSTVSTDGGTQMRADLNEAVVDEYEVAIRDGQDFPPIILFDDGAKYWLGDGFHRFFAYKKAGALEIPANIRTGTKRDAILFSAGANANHGLRRTNADKRKSVLTLLEDEEWGRWSDREIARRVGVGHPFVASIRADLTGRNSSDERAYTTRHGTPARMDTSNIGKRRPAEEPDAADDSGVENIAARHSETPEDIAKGCIAGAAKIDQPEAVEAKGRADAPAAPPAHERLIAALDMLDGITAEDIIGHCPPRLRALVSQRASSAIDMLGDVTAGIGQ